MHEHRRDQGHDPDQDNPHAPPEADEQHGRERGAEQQPGGRAEEDDAHGIPLSFRGHQARGQHGRTHAQHAVPDRRDTARHERRAVYR